MMDKKKEIAAISAVMALIHAENDNAVVIQTVPPTLPTYWAMYGRQTQMTDRSLIQRRVIKR